jgi:hypothetical protein
MGIMIDSVVLQLECKEEQITDQFFSGQQTKQPSHTVSIQKVFSLKHKEFKKKGLYYPIISAYKRIINGREEGVKLEIQVSLPKLLYCTNLWEIKPNDLEAVCQALHRCLVQTGVDIPLEVITKAILKRVDFSKIVRIPAMYGTAKQVTKKLSVFDYKQCSDFKFREYGDFSDGAAMKFYNDTQGYVVYDKISEIWGNGYTLQEQEIIKWYQETKQRRDVLRFEVSLERKQSMEAVLRRFIPNKKKDFILADIMSDCEVSKQVLLETFNKVFNKDYLPLITLAEMRENSFEAFLRDNDLPLAEHYKLYYWVNMMGKYGLRATLDYMKEKMPKTSFKRFKDCLIGIVEKLPKIEGEIPSLVSYLRKKHEEFELFCPTGDKTL